MFERPRAHAAEEGVSIVTVGYGTEHGSTIPLPSGGTTTLKRDASGEVVVTRYTPDLLAAAAEAGHGTFIPATTTDKAANIRRALSTLRVAQRAVEEGEDRSARFQIFLAVALVLLVIDTLLADARRTPRRTVAHMAAGGARPPALVVARASAIGAIVVIMPGMAAERRPTRRAGAVDAAPHHDSDANPDAREPGGRHARAPSPPATVPRARSTTTALRSWHRTPRTPRSPHSRG